MANKFGNGTPYYCGNLEAGLEFHQNDQMQDLIPLTQDLTLGVSDPSGVTTSNKPEVAMREILSILADIATIVTAICAARIAVRISINMSNNSSKNAAQRAMGAGNSQNINQ